VPRGRVRELFDRQVERLVPAEGLDGEVRRLLAKTASELGAAFHKPWRLRSTRAALAGGARRGLDRMATVVVRLPAPIEDLATLDQRAGQVRRGVLAALTAAQGLLATSAAATEGVGAPPALAVDAAVAQVASVLTGLAEWYLLGSYAVALMRQAGVDPEDRDLRAVVNAALLSRDPAVGNTAAVGDAEARIIARWAGRGLLEAVPLASAYPTRRVRRAGERLEATDPSTWPRRPPPDAAPRLALPAPGRPPGDR